MVARRASIVARPADAAEVRTFRFGDLAAIPNNRDLPVLYLPGAVAADAGAGAIRALMEANLWGGTWQYTVFDFHHDHPNAHEALIVSSGSAELMLGGPEGERVRVQAGDAIVLPAGTGHRRLTAAAGFQVCGGYPPGQEDYETVSDRDPRPDGVLERIASVPLPETDPIYGREGPLVRLWSP